MPITESSTLTKSYSIVSSDNPSISEDDTLPKDSSDESSEESSESPPTKNKKKSLFKKFSPLFVPEPPPLKLWRFFWHIVIAGLALRLLAAITGDWIMRADELFQYLEQAHRVVFGYGQIPWEFRFGERTWLLPMLSVPPLWLCKVLGLDSPEQYAPIVRSFHALLSMIIPLGMYFFSRRVCSEVVARCALILGCFWYELIIVAPHPIAESSSTIFIFAALCLANTNMTITRIAACGFFLGMALVLRAQYAPAIGLIGLMLLFYINNLGRIILILSGSAAILLAGLVDYFYWGGMWETYINYVKLQFSGYTKYTANQPWHIHLRYLLISSAGLFYVISIISLFHLRRFWVFIILMLAIQLLHNLAASKEYVNTLLAIPFFLLMASGIIAQWGAQKDEAPKDEDEEPKDEYKIPQQNLFIAGKKKALILLSICLLLSAAGLGVKLPNQQELFIFRNDKAFFYQSPFFAVNIALSKEPADKMKGIILLVPGTDTHIFGGYYYTHHDVPMYFPFSSNYDRQLLLPGTPLPKTHAEATHQNNAIFAQAGNIFARTASHLVLPDGIPVEGFQKITTISGMAIHVNNNTQQVIVAPGAAYDIMNNGIVSVLGILHQLNAININEKPLKYNKGAAAQ